MARRALVGLEHLAALAFRDAVSIVDHLDANLVLAIAVLPPRVLSSVPKILPDPACASFFLPHGR